MPPKKAGGKAEEKKKVKVVEDKTFGLKNKNKSSKVQKYIASLQQQAQPKRRPDATQPTKAEKKEADAARQAELDKLFKVVVDKKQTAAPGVDPRSVLCEWFVKGLCKKGAKCKFSHDLDIGRKAAKIDLYTDQRELKETDELTGADGEYDQSALDAAIAKKSNQTTTDIICKFFLEAIEKKLYGWFWECPNGPTCKYRHALPPGYVLKAQKKEEIEDDTEKLTLEEELDLLRAKIIEGAMVTHASFIDWKRRKVERKAKEALEARDKRDRDLKAGKDQMSGRELFQYNPDLFVDDEEGMEDTDIVREEYNAYDVSHLGKFDLSEHPTDADGLTAAPLPVGTADESQAADNTPVDESLFADMPDDVE